MAVVTVNTLSDTTDLNDGLTTLREAIFATNLVAGADTIDFAPSLTASGPAKILLTQGELKITDDLTINGPGANLLTIQAFDPTPTLKNGDGSGVFYIDDRSDASLIDVSIRGLMLTGADTNFGVRGGAITTKENLTIEDCIISENSASSPQGVGGGICSYTSPSGLPNTLTVRNSTLTGNIGGIDGGAIRKERGTLIIEDCNISNNSAEHTGGGVSADYGAVAVSISGSTIAGNRTTGFHWWGGGVFVNGGAFVNTPGNLTVASSTISGNSADRGGGIYAFCPTTVTDSVIAGNSAAFIGGGISGGYPLVITRCTISGNSAGTATGRISEGGGIAGGLIFVTDSTISGNSAKRGAGISTFTRTIPSEITGSTISGNISSLRGGEYTMPADP